MDSRHCPSLLVSLRPFSPRAGVRGISSVIAENHQCQKKRIHLVLIKYMLQLWQELLTTQQQLWATAWLAWFESLRRQSFLLPHCPIVPTLSGIASEGSSSTVAQYFASASKPSAQCSKGRCVIHRAHLVQACHPLHTSKAAAAFKYTNGTSAESRAASLQNSTQESVGSDL